MFDITLVDDAQFGWKLRALKDGLDALEQEFRPIPRTDDEGGRGKISRRG